MILLMILLSVFLLSLSSLTFEVLLTRVFSINQWNHLSFMVISIALFGFAASGTFLSILESKNPRICERLLSKGSHSFLVICYVISAIGSFICLNQLPLEYLKLPVEPIQALYLLIAYVLLAMPFFITGFAIAMAYAFFPAKTGFVYFATMTGSACGAALPVVLLPILGLENLIVMVSLGPLATIILSGFKIRRISDTTETPEPLKRNLALITFPFIIAMIALFFVFSDNLMVRVKPSPYKSLSQTLRLPRTKITETAISLRGRRDRVESPYIRFAQGLSLKFTDKLPRQWSVFKDGDAPLVLYDIDSPENTRFSRFTLPFLGYVLKPQPENVLLILNGGGSAIPCAMASGAQNISIVEHDPYVAGILRKQYQLPVIHQTPRSYLARSKTTYTIIHIEDWGPSLPGTAALTQQHLFTIEAFMKYFTHLMDDGILIISRKLLLPPADSLRLWSTAYESLRRLGMASPEEHIAIVRNWDTFTLIVSKAPLRDHDAIGHFARSMNFDLVFGPGITKDQVNRFNIFDAPFHYLEISRLLNAYKAGNEKTFFRSYLLDVAPQTDNRPFPSRFLKWNRLKKQFKTTGSRIYSLFLSGEIVVAIVFIEAFGVALFLLLTPLFVGVKGREKNTLFSAFYFLGVGAGFMFVELYFIKVFTHLFGDPIVSLTVVLSGILIFSGAGGIWSQRLGLNRLRIVLYILVATLLIAILILGAILHWVMRLPVTAHYLFAYLILFPIGFLVGLPFTLGMRYLLKTPNQRAYAWAINGSASVLTAIASAQIAISFGIYQLLIGAVLAYVLTLMSIQCIAKKV